MAERPPAQIAASKVETERKQALSRQRDLNRKNFDRAQAAKKADAVRDKSELGDRDLRNAWLFHYLGDANYNATKAAELAGYAESSAVGIKHKRYFAKQIADHFESTYLQKSEVVATLVNTWKGPGEYLAFDDGSVNVAQTVENLRQAGLMNLLVGVKETKDGTELKFRDPDAALGRIIQMVGLNAPVKVTLTLDGKTPEEVAAIAHAAKMRLAQAMIDAPREGDYIDADTSIPDD